ncbi:MAG: hypothetical protein ACT4OS_01485, partial [Acidimicrobiales bacterium]
MLLLTISADLPVLPRSVPEPLPIASTPPAIVSVAAGSSHSLARRFDGTVFGWGSNFSGQLGDGTTTNRMVPTQIVGLESVSA